MFLFIFENKPSDVKQIALGLSPVVLIKKRLLFFFLKVQKISLERGKVTTKHENYMIEIENIRVRVTCRRPIAPLYLPRLAKLCVAALQQLLTYMILRPKHLFRKLRQSRTIGSRSATTKDYLYN